MNYPSQSQQGQYPGMAFQQPVLHGPPYQQLGPALPKYPPYTQAHVSPTQLIAPHPPHQINPQPLTLTPAQLLQQQQGQPFPLMPPPGQPQMRIPFQRFPQERPHRQPGTPTLHDRPPSRHAHDRPQSQDIHDRPSSSASVRSHHHDPAPMMPPPGSRPGTASGPSRMNPHLMTMAPHMSQPQQMINPAAMGIPMNRPPTRTDSALGHASPKQSPRMSMGPISGPSVQGMGGGMMAGPNMAIPMGPQQMSVMPGMGGMGPMGPINMNASAPGNLATPGNMMGAPYMGPPQGMQRPEMQPHMREQSAPVSRETVSVVAPLSDYAHSMPQSLPPSSTGPFMALDNTGVPPNMSRQSSQPPPQQSPARQVPPPHRSPMPPIRKNEIPPPAPTPPVNVPPIPGTTPGQKLPPHIASLNPAVTRISYLPYVVPPKPSDATDASDQDKKPDEPTTETDATETNPPANIEDPIRKLEPSEIAALKDVMVRDSAYDTVYRAKQARMLQELRTAGPGGRLAWWDRDFAASSGVNRRPDRFDVRYPRPPRTDAMAARKKGARREGIRMSVPFLIFYSRDR